MRRRSWWLVFCSEVVPSASIDESEIMEMGATSVPKMSSGSKSRLEIETRSKIWESRGERGKDEEEHGLPLDGTLLGRHAASRSVQRPVLALGLILPRLLAFIRHGDLGFSLRATEEGKKSLRSERKRVRIILQSAGTIFYWQ